MKSIKLFTNSAIVTAVLASLCCITPVLAVLAGLGGLASFFSFMEPLRPFFIGFTVIVLGLAFYNAYKPKKADDIDCACDTSGDTGKKKFINSKTFLWMVAIVVLVLITFPYYSGAFFASSTAAPVSSDTQLAKVVLNIEGMTCTGCEQAVNHALTSQPGVFKAESNHKTGLAVVEYDSAKVDVNQLKQAVEKQAGYTVKSVQKKKGEQ